MKWQPMPACAREPFGHLGRGVVRAAGAEVRHALDRVAFVREQLGDGEVAHEVAPVELREAIGEPARDDLDQARRPQLAELADERLAARVALADHLRPHGAVVEEVAQLLLDQAGLLLDDEDLVEAVGERVEPRRLDRIGEADLVDANAGGGERIERDVEAAEDLEQVEVRLAAGDDADRRARARDDVAVDRIDLRERAHRVELGVQALLDLQRRQVGPAIVQAVGGRTNPVAAATVAPSFHAATRAFVSSRSTVEPLSTTSESAVKPTQLPEKRDSAQPYRPNSRYSATLAGASTGMCHDCIAASLWCGIDDETQPWSSPATTRTPPCGDAP
jgi:hypothetical protein